MPAPVPEFPTHIQIQTTVACGAACNICPHPIESPSWTNGLMSDALFESIVDQLRGRPVVKLSPYLMADPLSDKKIFERVRTIRDALPETEIEISTTGKYLLKPLRAKLLATPLSELRISSHGITEAEYARTMPGVDHAKAMVNIHAFIEEWKQTKPYPLSIVCLFGLWTKQREREIHEYWRSLGVELSTWRVTTRANQVDLTVFGESEPDPTTWNAGIRDGAPYRCRFNRDTEWLHILSDGRVVLCCMDYKQEAVIGSLLDETIEELWHSEAFERTRAMVRGDIETPPDSICKRCDWYVSESIYEQEEAGRQAKAAQAERARVALPIAS